MMHPKTKIMVLFLSASLLMGIISQLMQPQDKGKKPDLHKPVEYVTS